MRPENGWTDAFLDENRRAADPLADATIEAILDSNGLSKVNELLGRLQKNNQVPTGFSPAVTAFLEESDAPPAWKDPELIRRGEKLFFDYGLMSALALFCSSLPECFVLEAEAKVLHLAGNLEAHTGRRIRETARMIFPVMEAGGLGPQGGGIRQIQKVRLIHAAIRRLILTPVPEHLRGTKPRSFAEVLQQTTWDTAEDGLPINQEQLAYTLLTFGYNFARSLRRLGVEWTTSDEEAYIHCWNVAGHHLGIHHDLMATTMADSEELFASIQRRHAAATEHGRSLADALLSIMEQQIPSSVLRPFPAVLTRILLGSHVSDLLGIKRRHGPLTRALVAGLRGLIWVADGVLRFLRARSWTARFVSRVLARRFIKSLLVKNAFDASEPLQLPDGLLNSWKQEPGRWRITQRLEDYLAGDRAETPPRSGRPG